MARLMFVLFLISLLTCVFVISQNKITDMFVASIYAVAQKVINTGVYQREPFQAGVLVGNWDWQGHANGLSYYPSTAIIYTVLSLVTAVPIDVLIFIPFGILFLIIAFLAFASKLLRNTLFIFVYILIQVFYLRIVYTLSYHILGLFFHTLVLAILYKRICDERPVSRFSLVLFPLYSPPL